jgi:hypothetical protein
MLIADASGKSCPPPAEDRSLAQCLWRLAGKSWLSLEDSQRRWFSDSLSSQYPGKGRNVCGAIYDLGSQSLDPSFSNPNAVLDDEIRSQELGRLALGHIKSVRAVIAIDLDVANFEELGQAVVRFLRPVWRKAASGRTHEFDWLVTITEFESAYEKWHKACSKGQQVQAPARAVREPYYNLLEGFDF